MLPFLKRTQDAASSSPVEHIDMTSDKEYDPMESAAEDLCNAIHAKDYKAAAEALKAAFELSDKKDVE